MAVTPITLDGIDDPEAFVRSQLPRVILTPDKRDELVQAGLLILVRLARRYEPGKGGRDPSGSTFDGFAAKYLQRKLRDEWHKLEGHTLTTVRREGQVVRVWKPNPQPTSLDRISEETEGADHVRALHCEDSYDTDLAERLGNALDEQWRKDREATVNVGVLLAEGVTPGIAAKRLKMRGPDVLACIDRIRKATPYLTTLEAA